MSSRIWDCVKNWTKKLREESRRSRVQDALEARWVSKIVVRGRSRIVCADDDDGPLQKCESEQKAMSACLGGAAASLVQLIESEDGLSDALDIIFSRGCQDRYQWEQVVKSLHTCIYESSGMGVDGYDCEIESREAPLLGEGFRSEQGLRELLSLQHGALPRDPPRPR